MTGHVRTQQGPSSRWNPMSAAVALVAALLVLLTGCDSPSGQVAPSGIVLHGGPVPTGSSFDLQISGQGLDASTQAVLSRDIGNRSQVLNQVKLWGTIHDLALQGDYAYIANNTRGLVVVEVADFERPRVIGSLDLPDRTMRVLPRGDLLFAANLAAGVQIIDISAPDEPSLLSSVLIDGEAFALDVADDYLYVAATRGGLAVVDISEPRWPVQVASLPLPGQTLAVKRVGHYLYLAGSETLSVVDISSPARPVLIEQLALAHNGFEIDYSGDRLYVALGPYGLLVLDVDDLGALTPIEQLSDLGNVKSIAFDADRAYLASNFGVLVLDLTASLHPALLGGVKGNISVTDVAVRQGIGLTTDTRFGLEVIDLRRPKPFGFSRREPDGRPTYIYDADLERLVDSKAAVTPLSYDEMKTIYSLAMMSESSIWALASNAAALARRGNTVYFATSSGILVVDFRRPDDPLVLDRLTEGREIVDLTWMGETLTAATADGELLLYTCGETGRPHLIGRIEAPDRVTALAASDQLVCLLSRDEGLSLFDFSDPFAPRRSGSLVLPYPLGESTQALDVAIRGRFAYIADVRNGLLVVDIGDPSAPELRRMFRTEGTPHQIFIEGTNLYLAEGRRGLSVYDISEPLRPVMLSRAHVPVSVRGVEVAGEQLGLVTRPAGLFWVDKPIHAEGSRLLGESSISFSFPAVTRPGRYNLRISNQAGGETLVGAVTVVGAGGGE